MNELAAKHSEHGNLYDLLQPGREGLFSHVTRFRPGGDEPQFVTSIAHAGDISQVWTRLQANGCGHHRKPSLNGAGTGLTYQESLIPTLGEGLERYCTAMYSENQFIWATAEDLGNDAVDLNVIPRCSSAELLNPKCPLVMPDKKAPIRWVKSISLHDGRIVYLPAVMVYLYVPPVSRAERICIQITTGCAGHISYERALLAAILEVVERDAISLTWLQRLALPQISIHSIPSTLRPFWNRYLRSSKHLKYHFFDATTDLGVPIVYGLQVCRENPRFSTLVSCSSALDPVEALTKVMRELASCRMYLSNQGPHPTDWNDFTELHHGASLLGHAEQGHAFNFLLESNKKRELNEIRAIEAPACGQPLQAVLKLFRDQQMDVYAVDLSTDEAIRCGVRVVRVVIPTLQPFSFNYRARYLGHPRLYEAPRKMGYPAYSEESLNHWPQPFA